MRYAMALSLRNKQLEELARALAYERGESITDAILEALEARLNQLGPVPRLSRDIALMENAALRIAALPVLSGATPDEIIGYDQDGLPA
jgi:antitoxin VapB